MLFKDCVAGGLIKVFHSLTAVKAVRVPLYLGHSIQKGESIPLYLLQYFSLIRTRYPFTAGLTVFQLSDGEALPTTFCTITKLDYTSGWSALSGNKFLTFRIIPQSMCLDINY